MPVPIARLIATSAFAAIATACTSLQPDPGEPGARAAASGTCNADPVQWAIGEDATQPTMGRAWRESGAGLIRPIAPGQPITKDLRPDRLNVELDRENRITRLYCG